MTDYIKYNPLDEITFPVDGAPILCVVHDRKYNNWGVDAGYADSETITVWNERFKSADIYWKKVILPKEEAQ